MIATGPCLSLPVSNPLLLVVVVDCADLIFCSFPPHPKKRRIYRRAIARSLWPTATFSRWYFFGCCCCNCCGRRRGRLDSSPSPWLSPCFLAFLQFLFNLLYGHSLLRADDRQARRAAGLLWRQAEDQRQHCQGARGRGEVGEVVECDVHFCAPNVNKRFERDGMH